MGKTAARLFGYLVTIFQLFRLLYSIKWYDDCEI